jgi:hypothetical protein
LSSSAEPSNGNPELEQAVRATGDERWAILDRYSDTTGPGPGATHICFDIGCWEPAKESWEQFLSRARRA